MTYIMSTLLFLGFVAIGTVNYRSACRAGPGIVKEYCKDRNHRSFLA